MLPLIPPLTLIIVLQHQQNLTGIYNSAICVCQVPGACRWSEVVVSSRYAVCPGSDMSSTTFPAHASSALSMWALERETSTCRLCCRCSPLTSVSSYISYKKPCLYIGSRITVWWLQSSALVMRAHKRQEAYSMTLYCKWKWALWRS